jgi:ketosteroid isomerase-like protein
MMRICRYSPRPEQIEKEHRMSAADNKKLIETIFAAIAAGDRTPFVESLADDVTMRITGQYSWSQTFRGKEALLRDLYGYLGTLLADGRRTIAHRFIADGDHVVMEGVGEMRTKAGVPYNNDYCLIYRLKDGKIVEIREYCDSALTEKVLGKYPARATA